MLSASCWRRRFYSCGAINIYNHQFCMIGVKVFYQHAIKNPRSIHFQRVVLTQFYGDTLFTRLESFNKQFELDKECSLLSAWTDQAFAAFCKKNLSSDQIKEARDLRNSLKETPFKNWVKTCANFVDFFIFFWFFFHFLLFFIFFLAEFFIYFNLT